MTTFPGFPNDGRPFSAAEVGEAWAAMFRRDGSGLPVSGVLANGPSITAVSSSWKVQITPFSYILRVGNGVRISGVSSSEQVDIEPAASTPIPAGQARIDHVVWDPASSQLLVATGEPAVTPIAAPTGGMVSLATVRVNFGDNAVVAAQITPTFTTTALANAPRVAVGTIAKQVVQPAKANHIPITFPAGLFTSPPNVQATVWGDARDTTATVDAITTEGCIVRIGSVSIGPRTVGAHWRAEQI